MSSPDVIPGEFNFLTPLDSYLFIALLHFFLLTLHIHINNESLRSNLVRVVWIARPALVSKNNIILHERRSLGQSLYIYKLHRNYSTN